MGLEPAPYNKRMLLWNLVHVCCMLVCAEGESAAATASLDSLLVPPRELLRASTAVGSLRSPAHAKVSMEDFLQSPQARALTPMSRQGTCVRGDGCALA